MAYWVISNNLTQTSLGNSSTQSHWHFQGVFSSSNENLWFSTTLHNHSFNFFYGFVFISL